VGAKKIGREARKQGIPPGLPISYDGEVNPNVPEPNRKGC